MYFLRDTNKPVKTAVATDESVVCGELSSELLTTYESTISEVYVPLLETQKEWGCIKGDKQKSSFLKQTNKFVENLRKKINNLRGDLELNTPSAPFDEIEQKPSAYTAAAEDKPTVEHFVGIVESWINSISTYIANDPSNTPMEAKDNSGPDVEIEYWQRRMLTLISITEQLKLKDNRVVTGVLRARTLVDERVEDGSVSLQEKSKAVLEKWREIDMSITDALNEAKDNVRFLGNLGKIIEPLYTEKPTVIADSMPSIMNSMKMIHTLSRHYGTEIRMTNLFQRITNQMINRCIAEIYDGQPAQQLWKKAPGEVIRRMNDSIKLFEVFNEQYQETKQKLAAMPKGKQFNFDPSKIFHKSTLFCRRLEKLIDMFSSIQQFHALERKHIDGMERLIISFDNLISDFKLKGHDLLDYNNTAFERDFVEYTMHNSGLENAIQDFMGRSLTQMSSIDKQLELMKKFKDILHREVLQEDLEHKYLAIFKLYGEELHAIQQLYEKHKHDPPIPRNMTRIAGNIHWSRQLLRRITSPMQKFQDNPKVFHPKESKKIVKHYNKLARTLIEFETLWYQAWQRSADQAKKGLRSPLIVKDPESKTLHTNFDHGVLQLMRESKHLQLMGFQIPNSAKTVLLLEDKLKSYFNKIDHTIQVYNRVMSMVSPETKCLMKPHIKDLERTIRPALTTMTWTSMNIETFLYSLHQVLSRFEFLVTQLNDIISNRVQKNLDYVSNMLVLNIPQDRCFNLRGFTAEQKKYIETCTEVLKGKNVEIERAVNDLIEAVQSYQLDPSIEKTSEFDCNRVRLHYCHLMYHALLSVTKGSLNVLKGRMVQRASKKGPGYQPLFEVDLSLQVPEVCFSPSLDDVQETINTVAREVLQCTKSVLDWGVSDSAEARGRRSFLEKLAADKNLAIVLLMLSGAIEDLKNSAQQNLEKFHKYDWLWKKEPEEEYATFVRTRNPILEDFISELHTFVAVEQEICNLPETETMGALNLKTENLKLQFKNETERWKFQYSEKLHQEVKHDMEEITDAMKELKTKLQREVKDFASLKFVMDAQAEVRAVQSGIDIRFQSIIERYNTLEKYLPFGVMSKEEMDAKSILRTEWTSILKLSEDVMATVNELQGGFKQDLVQKVVTFKKDVSDFRTDYNANGPMVRGTSPQEAMTRLNKFKREYESLSRKYELYNGGEKLFGLPEQNYPVLTQTGKELRLLDQLYSLYQAVITTIDSYKEIPWSEVVANISEMNETVEGFANRCRKLPKGLKEWPAFAELKQTIEDFIEVLPLLNELSKPAMRQRHWEQITALTGKEFDLKRFNELKLRSVLEANLLKFREDIEEITDGADKQLGIEKKIHDIVSLWDTQIFQFSPWKERGDVILNGGIVAEIVEQLEESQAALIQMLTMRHVTPFRELATSWLKKLSEVNDILEGWIKVQMLWMSLEAVFTGGDIARNLPQDTRVFMKVDKEWTTRMMSKAKDVENVVESCQNEYIKNMLPTMHSDLEKCQKALDGYLEAKRSKFPRFYFVSNPALLLILSQGSDKEAVQGAFAKIFDSIDRVEFKGNNIVKIRALNSGFDGVMDSEDIPLTAPVAATGNIEDWLMDLQKEMARTIKDIVRAGAADFESMPLAEFLTNYCAQISLLGIQFMWTSDVQEALNRAKHDKSSMMNAFKKQAGVLSELSAMTTQDIKTKMERTKIETLVTIQVHQRDVLESLVQKFKKKELKDAYDFEWQKQLRCYWVPEDDECVVKIADVDFDYCYEYLGCKERLVVTPLTDRCYISLSQACGMFFGGAPAGPAGTGKTETVKDLGRALGKLVVVFNCSDQMHTADTAKIYKGLCQSGSWGCFDEFNRIDLEVLSVVAQQVMAILNAMRARIDKFSFPGDAIGDVILDPRCGFFITMNPGYAGRQELPENLKALFRGVAMMVPDREIIIKVKLASVGYTEFPALSKKFRVLYKLCEEQLSKQRHYDFGLRNILSVLRTAGVNLRIELNKENNVDRADLEEMLMMRTLRDMNLSKLVSDDVSLFISLLHDLFPNQKDPEKRRYDAEEEAMKRVIERRGLIHHEAWVNKCIQLYETSLVRHGLMMVGPAGGGKTTATEVLLEALSECHEKHLIVKMNPKAIKAEEMFGQNDLISGEWTHGIFSSIWFKYNDIKKPRTWIVCDGPVDAIWIENLNTVLDDNKLLTLANGDRIPMTDNVRLLFEVQDLRNASPATVSRAGIVFVSDSDLGHDPLVRSWLLKRREEEKVLIEALYEKYVDAPETLDWINRNTRTVMPVLHNHLISNLLCLLEGVLAESVEQQKVYAPEEIERLFLYSLAWSIGGLFEQEDRVKFSNFLKNIGGDIVPADADDTVYEYFVPLDTLEWKRWEAPEWKFPSNFRFSNCLVPTVDSVRVEYLIGTLQKKLQKPVLVVGSSGTAKTSTVLQYAQNFDSTSMLLKKVNFSSATTAGMFQSSIEADIEKRQGKTYAPAGGRWMTVFLDDMSMPEVNAWGDQPTLEIVRQLVESKGFYFLEKDKRGDRMTIENMQFIAAMSHPGGGRNDIPKRLKRHFFAFNMTPPSQQSIDNIYGSMLQGQFAARTELVGLIPQLTKGTIDLWAKVRARMLPTPSKFHYIFNMRDLSRIFQGILHSPVDTIESSNQLISLWTHECRRVLSDKLVSSQDKSWFEDTAKKVTSQWFGADVASGIANQEEPTYFVDFLRDDVIDEETEEVVEEAPKIYEQVKDVQAMKARVNDFLNQYNEIPGIKRMDLVLFTDALEHMMRIARIIGMPRGNALLVGVGGSGRQSLTRLAAHIAGQETFQIQLTRNYKMADFLDDIRKLYVLVGKEGKKCTWVVTDFEIINENFLEYINAILATGEVAGLFPKDERDMMCSDLRGAAKAENPDFDDTPDNLYKYFIDRIRDNLHIVLCFSPANEKFAERARRFPGLINGVTIDWFLRWPEEALENVSRKFILQDPSFEQEGKDSEREGVVKHIANVHNIVVEACEEYFQKYRKHVYVTPKSYLSFIAAYKKLYSEKLLSVGKQEEDVTIGLEKLMQAEKDVGKMQVVLEKQNVELAEADKAANEMIAKLEVGAKEANTQKKIAEGIETKCSAEAEIIESEKAEANKELEAAMPFVRAAEEAAKSINKKDIGVIQKFGKPPDLIKRIMDCVLILCQRPLDKISMTEIKTGKNDVQPFIMDSYETHAKKMMVEAGFVNLLLEFSVLQKDKINEETMEFLEPYLLCPDFNSERAKSVASAAEGLCKWVRAMASYHEASLIVGPKLEQLQVKSDAFASAMEKLNAAKASSQKAQDEVDRLQDQFSKTMAEKARLEKQAKATQDKMKAANDLIHSLAGEKDRWGEDAKIFAANKRKLLGDCALACAFVSYCGPFNFEFRKKLMECYFYDDASAKGIPVSKNLSITDFLVDAGTIAEWNSQGLPKDDLSVQNGILVTQASRFPLLIDPQGQALSWLKKREANNFPVWGTTTLSNPKLRDQLEFCLEEGKPLLIEGIVNDVDPMLDPVLEKLITKKGRSYFLQLGDKRVGYDPNFRLYLVTKLSNSVFSPELSAKTTIIDFSVTQKGLEDQLLSRVIQQEQASLEEQRQKLIEEVNMNTISLQTLDKQLLERLSASQGDLLEDIELIGVLADTKKKAKEVKEKIEASYTTEQIINQKREQYRPVATRGSVLYFTIVETSNINCMYQTSLAQFLGYFDGSLRDAEKANLVAKRVENLIKHLTFNVYENVSRGLFEKDKITFKLMMTTKILLTESPELLNSDMVNILLRGGAGLNIDQVPKKPYDWLNFSSWMNVINLSMKLDFFRDIKNSIASDEAKWREWYEEESPEEAEIPSIEERLQTHPSGAFLRLLLVRSMRDDRTRLAANNFIASVLGNEYTQPLPTRMDKVWSCSDFRTPVILLLTPGADPTSTLEELAKKKGLKISAVSMGEGQEPHAQRCIENGMTEGGWALLQNCHLGLGFMADLDEMLKKYYEETEVNEDFRLWITCEPHPDFPINLLQLGVKVTNEPPAGMKAGLFRSYNTVVDDERLQRVDNQAWRDLVYSTCFLHSVVQERRKFGPVGWCIPYEFNQSDLEASLTFLEKHFFASAQSGLSWDTIQYMICEVQYGGRITDDFDRILFNTFGKAWLNPNVLAEKFEFTKAHGSSKYILPRFDEVKDYRDFISEFPNHDSPEIFGLHQNADLTFGTNEANYILNTISDTQPKQASGGGSGKTREEVVFDKADELLALMPKGYVMDEVRAKIKKRPKAELQHVLNDNNPGQVDGFSIPLNVFLFQEIARLQDVIHNVRSTLENLKQAINGEIIMTPELQDALNSVFDAKPPRHWYVDAGGAQTAWDLPSLALWFTGLVDREAQLSAWLNGTRPNSYWMTGFFNPQGFLTAMRQEVTRRHKHEKWALDDMVLISKVTDVEESRKVKKQADEGVYIHGLFLEGCTWDSKAKVLVESQPKELYTPLPVLHVSATISSKAKKFYDSGKFYDCPVYMKPRRTDLAFVFTVKMPSNVPPEHWVLRGVALLCSKD